MKRFSVSRIRMIDLISSGILLSTLAIEWQGVDGDHDASVDVDRRWDHVSNGHPYR